MTNEDRQTQINMEEVEAAVSRALHNCGYLNAISLEAAFFAISVHADRMHVSEQGLRDMFDRAALLRASDKLVLQDDLESALRLSTRPGENDK